MKRAWSDHARTVETTTALETLLATGTFARVDLLRVLLRFGLAFGFTELCWASSDADVTWDGKLYKALGATRFTRSQIRTQIGTEVDTLTLTLTPYVSDPSGPGQVLDVIPGTTVTIPQAVQQGLFDKAIVELRTLFLPTPPQWHVTPDVSAGAVLQFVGDVGDGKAKRSTLELQVRSRLDALRMSLPRNKYQAGCLNQLYDATCGIAINATVNGAAVQQAATVDCTQSTTMRLVLTSAPSQAKGFFDLGYVQVWAGPFIGLGRTVKGHDGTVLTLTQPFPQGVFPASGTQAVVLQAGCDKTLKTCVQKFANRTNFRGFPFVPTPESAY